MVLFIHLRTRKMPFDSLVFTLRSKGELNWTRAIRHVIAQSIQFSKIAKKLNIDLCQFFSHRKEALSLLNKIYVRVQAHKNYARVEIRP